MLHIRLAWCKLHWRPMAGLSAYNLGTSLSDVFEGATDLCAAVKVCKQASAGYNPRQDTSPKGYRAVCVAQLKVADAVHQQVCQD